MSSDYFPEQESLAYHFHPLATPIVFLVFSQTSIIKSRKRGLKI
jgi:hypothetical protein